MTTIPWTTGKTVAFGNRQIPISPELRAGRGQVFGIKADTPARLALKRVLWPLKKLHDDVLVDGFVETEVGRLIQRFLRPDDVVLDIGCGDMSLRRFLPPDMGYNALDIEFSAFHLRRVMAEARPFNPVIASATAIPAADASASLIISTETFTNIPGFRTALAEIRRIARPQARLICSVPNEHCRKYAVKGDNPRTRSKWTYHEFIALMDEFGFDLKHGAMKGYWVRLPRWLTDVSYHLPISSRREDRNICFFYVFERRGPATGATPRRAPAIAGRKTADAAPVD